jgi:hypothetical protein
MVPRSPCCVTSTARARADAAWLLAVGPVPGDRSGRPAPMAERYRREPGQVPGTVQTAPVSAPETSAAYLAMAPLV